jgi:hypothetical protein
MLRIDPNDSSNNLLIYVSAYFLKDGILHDLKDEDGIISTDMLDEASNSILEEFSRLLNGDKK